MGAISYPSVNDQLRYTFGAGAAGIYIPPTISTVSPPTTTTPGRPAVDPTQPQNLGGGGGCGCGGGGASPYPGTLPVLTPEVGTLPGKSLTSPAGTSTTLFGGDTSMFDNIDWSRDWWKFLAGALAYKLLVR